MTNSNEQWSVASSKNRKVSVSLMLMLRFMLPILSVSSSQSSKKNNSKILNDIPTWNLPNDVTYPVLASNTASLSASQTEAMVRKSLSLGITNIDFHLGGTERDGVAAVLRNVPRDSIFLVTKMDKPPADMTDPEEAAQLVRSTVDKEWPLLGVNNVDVLLLKDSSSCDVMQAQWRVLEELLEDGKTRALGTYNYCQFSIDCILEIAIVPPALNYIMGHVGNMDDSVTDLIHYGEARGIRTVLYGTLGEPVALEELLSNAVLFDISFERNRSIEEVALRYNIQQRGQHYAVSNRPYADYAPSNKPNMASCGEGIHANCAVALSGMREVFNWKLTKEDMKRLDEVKLVQYSQSPTYYSSTGCPNSFGVVDHPTDSSCKQVDAAWCDPMYSTW